MGIHGLTKVVGDNAASAIRENPIKHYFGKSAPSSSVVVTDECVVGRKIAIDASMSMYQFLIAVRQEGQVLTTDTGETTR